MKFGRVLGAVFSLFIIVLVGCSRPAEEGKIGERLLYPQPSPDTVALSFLPNIVSSDSVEFNAAFSPDGKAFYFSRNNGMKSHIYVTHFADSQWSVPVQASFSDPRYSDADPAFSPDGRLHFISNRPGNPEDTTSDFDIWFLEPGGNTNEPVLHNLTAVNTDSTEYYVSFTQAGNLYFASSRAGGFGAEDIYVSKWQNGSYSLPENLGSKVNSAMSEYDPFVSPGEDFLIFASSNRVDGFGKGDLYASTLNSSKEWEPAFNLGSAFNTPSREFCPYLTSDYRYFFFTSNGEVKWVRSSVLMDRLKSGQK